MTTLVLFSLPNGAEVIAKHISAAADGFIVEHPLVLRPFQNPSGQPMLDLFPHSLANPDGEHQFFASQILSKSMEIPEALQKAYLERTSNIIIASAMDDLERMK